MDEKSCCASGGGEKNPLESRIDAIGWALFLIMIGGLMLAPEGRIPDYAWLIGVGLILLGVNGVKRLGGIKMSGFTIILGIIALACGIFGFYGVDLPVFPILIIIFGASIILKPIFGKNKEKSSE